MCDVVFVLMAQNSSHLGRQIEIFDFDDDMDNDLADFVNPGEGSVGGGN